MLLPSQPGHSCKRDFDLCSVAEAQTFGATFIQMQNISLKILTDVVKWNSHLQWIVRAHRVDLLLPVASSWSGWNTCGSSLGRW